MKVAGRLLTADADTRTLRYRLLPYGEPGNTNLGKVTASAGVLSIPEDPAALSLNLEHDYTRPVGKFASVEDTPAGIDAAVRLAATTAGNDALMEAAEGLRTGISVEIEDAVIRDGKLMGGRLTGAGLVVRPAFPSAQLVAADAGELADEAAALADAATAHATNLADAAAEADPEEETSEEEEETVIPQSTTPAAFSAPAAPKLTARQTFMATIKDTGKLEAALDPIIQADVFDATTVPAFVGEIWTGRDYFQRFAPLVSHAPLTAQKMTGWRWVSTPEVGDYAGNLAEVPTNEVKAEPFDFEAKRVASGHKIDRIHVDMPNPAFWDSFYRERANNYSRLMDSKVIAHLTDAANSTAATVAAGVTDPWHKLIVGAQTALEFAVPDFAIVGADLYQQMALTTELDKLAFLNASLGLEEGQLANFRIVGAPISNTALNGKVIVGASASTTLYELAGSPIRVEALDVAHGGVDAGLFGYYALETSDKRGIVSVGNAA